MRLSAVRFLTLTPLLFATTACGRLADASAAAPNPVDVHASPDASSVEAPDGGSPADAAPATDAEAVYRVVLPITAGFLAVTPRGLFATTLIRRGIVGVSAHLWFAPADGSSPRDLGDVEAPGGLAAVDGTAFVGENDPNPSPTSSSQIAAIDVDGTVRTLAATANQVTGVAADSRAVFWGESIVTSEDYYAGSAMRLPFDDGGVSCLAHTEGTYVPVLDGAYLYWSRGFGIDDNNPPTIVGSSIERAPRDAVLATPETVTVPPWGTGTWAFGVAQGLAVFVASGSGDAFLGVQAPDGGADRVAPWGGLSPDDEVGMLFARDGRAFYVDPGAGELLSWAPEDAKPTILASNIVHVGPLVVDATTAYIATYRAVIAVPLVP
jgi:hypothetical protein